MENKKSIGRRQIFTAIVPLHINNIQGPHHYYVCQPPIGDDTIRRRRRVKCKDVWTKFLLPRPRFERQILRMLASYYIAKLAWIYPQQCYSSSTTLKQLWTLLKLIVIPRKIMVIRQNITFTLMMSSVRIWEEMRSS